MIWAFVDYENVGSALEGLSLSEYERVFVFCGPKNPRVKLGAPPTDGFCRVELIGVTTAGPNNLDFHLAFHLGRFHEIADKDVAFHIVSADGDFNGLVNHLKKIGRHCKKVAIKPAVKQVSDAPAVLSEAASLVVSRLKLLDGRKRPRKRDGFVNWIKSQCQGMSNIVPELVCSELIKAKLVRENGTDISYEIER
jgi:hypothetical protein